MSVLEVATFAEAYYRSMFRGRASSWKPARPPLAETLDAVAEHVGGPSSPGRTARRQFDALIHLDETRALEPLERTNEWEAGEVPETYPSAL